MLDWRTPLRLGRPRGELHGTVLHVLVPEPAGEVGGADLHVLDLACAQSSGSALCPTVLATSNPEYAARLNAAGLSHFPGHVFGPHTGPWFRALARLPLLLPVRIVHSHGYDANYLTYALRRLFPRRWGRIPTVMTCHGWVEDTLVHRLKTVADFFTYQTANALIICSEGQRQRLSGSRQRIEYVPNGVPLPTGSGVSGDLLRRRYAIPHGRPLVGIVGRLAREKRQDVFLEACRVIAGQEPDVHFLIVGSGAERKRLEAIAAKPPLRDRVTFTGLVADMAEVYAALTLLVLSSDTETTSRVVIEGMASGLPVVSTAVGGVPELLVHGKHGYLVERGDAASIARFALLLLRDCALRERLGRSAHERAAGFSVERMRERVERVYAALLTKPSAGQRP